MVRNKIRGSPKRLAFIAAGKACSQIIIYNHDAPYKPVRNRGNIHEQLDDLRLQTAANSGKSWKDFVTTAVMTMLKERFRTKTPRIPLPPHTCHISHPSVLSDVLVNFTVLGH